MSATNQRAQDRFDLEASKTVAFSAVDENRELLVSVSRQIFERPELCFEEHFAHDLLTQVLESSNIATTRSAFGLSTAFEARAGTTGQVVAVVCEYDALPEIGHACGHNIIAAAGLGAALAVAPLAESLGGSLRVLGTPAEEAGGGKEFMIRAGALADVDVAMMVHPADSNLPGLTTLAFHGLEVDYHGVASHAAAAPENGRNALDAAVLGYMNVAALRQHIRPDERIHGIFTHGGDKANIVPKHASAQWFVRSPHVDSLEALKQRVVACLRAGSDAAGCTMDLRWLDPPYLDMIDNAELLDRYRRNAELLGRPFNDSEEAEPVVGSTDMGNISHHVPSIHPLIAVAPRGISIHTADFARYAGGEAGDEAVIDGAKALAATVLDCWAEPLRKN